MDSLIDLEPVQRNILIASILGDGEITKIYKNSRRKNNSYREHYGIQQLEYRKWKEGYMNGLFYLTSKSSTLRSKSSPLFTELYPLFYSTDGKKQIPAKLLEHCTLPHFLAILYMDDGSLCITPRINPHKKRIYLTPHIYLYLQNYHLEDLHILNTHISTTFNITLKIGKKKGWLWLYIEDNIR
ncbi:LAGLIDADG DNA endonuclease [Oceanobacillus massiliensis]|uniref:LAGLIDADG DNA endonuclease n=1 Tax=Oceanobacillus massiliensis TaxID=1465765 RepID=UPI0002880494|nr:LAGLIDADG DNA endonuclease [Oceanobacillus massiliensis]